MKTTFSYYIIVPQLPTQKNIWPLIKMFRVHGLIHKYILRVPECWHAPEPAGCGLWCRASCCWSTGSAASACWQSVPCPGPRWSYKNHNDILTVILYLLHSSLHCVVWYFWIFNYMTISCIYLFLTPNSRSVFRAGVSLNIHSFIHSFIHNDIHNTEV